MASLWWFLSSFFTVSDVKYQSRQNHPLRFVNFSTRRSISNWNNLEAIICFGLVYQSSVIFYISTVTKMTTRKWLSGGLYFLQTQMFGSSTYSRHCSTEQMMAFVSVWGEPKFPKQFENTVKDTNKKITNCVRSIYFSFQHSESV